MSTQISGDTGVDKFQGTTIAGHIIQVQNYPFSAMDTGTTPIPYDNTIPQITEGKQFMSAIFTPKKANSKLKITTTAILTSSVSAKGVVALFRDSSSNAIATSIDNRLYAAGTGGVVNFISYVDVVSVTTTTFTVRAGIDRAGTITFNGELGSAYFGGTLASSITIEEIAQ